MFPTLRQVMEDLERAGDLRRIDAPVDPNQELAALLSLTESGPATVATRVVGSPFPVVANLVNSRDRLARSVGLNTGALTDALIGAVARPVPPVPAPGPAPVQTVVCEPRLDRLPVPRFFELETGPYITGGVTLVRDAVNGQRNLSFARYKVLSATRAMLGVSPNHHLGQMARRAQAVGQDLPVAVAIGVHPAIMLAACLYLGFGEDELECAGALMGGPVETVPGVSVDVAV
ncbi:MAG: UbiD family decarboxylase, partial [Bifidobacteriaceae bacterium]|nr:UbiD family decarboxylase [Bifidobacteriaceae bacterium]